MTKDEAIKKLSNDLFDAVNRYHEHMTSAELIGILELHKQELIWHHFTQIKKEMTT